ncbi:hypothetical protein [Parasphingorhabdus sp.]|uniref:hypothetical protein n=1 Tax=Parasphingorhabdus sp. TaxID=2709688 RepID=UPI003C7409D9
MANLLKAGMFYFLGVFALGFILGSMRLFFLVPFTGPVVAILIEIPLMLLFAWFFCRFLTGRFEIPPETNQRLVMGLVAFAFLMTGEALIAILLQEGRLTDFIMTFDLPENRVGLGAQIAFALFPLIQSYTDVGAGR